MASATDVERLGRFELVSHLASGGMAKVFLARVAGLAGFERHVVLKTLRKEDIPDESYVGMFLDEARLAASLHHQHVAQVYDVGCTPDGTYFLAMEYIHGKTVRSVMETVDDRRLWLPLDFGLSVVAAAAAGLHHAHERCRSDGTPLHIVHRDVSPSNVLVSYDGSIKLIDFGIAKATERMTHTRTGFIKGKAGYMAPEQARGYAVDRRSDVFSLGVLAYELTTQHRAYDAPTEFERIEKIVHGDLIPPSHWMPDYPPELEAAVLTALSLDPDDRFESADEMRIAIEACAKADGLVLGGAPVARLLAMLYGQPLEPWIAPPPNVAKGSGSHDSLVFVPNIPDAIDESSDITKPVDRELTEAEVLVDVLADRHAANARHVAMRAAADAERDASATASLRAQLPRAGTIKPPARKPPSIPPPLPSIVATASAQMPVVRPAAVPPPIPMLIQVDTPSAPIEIPTRAFTKAPPPVTIQPRKRKQAARTSKLRKQVMAIIACGAVLGLAIGATITVLGTDDAPAIAAKAAPATTPTKTRSTAAPPAPTKAAMATVPNPTPEIAPAPAIEQAAVVDTVTLTVTSSPPGATVVLDGVRLGTTPFVGSIPAAKKSGTLKVRMRNHLAVKTTVDRTTDIRWDVRLPPAKR